MKKILFLYYSHSGHTEKMILAAAEGAREAGSEVIVKKTPDAVVDDLVNCDAVILGTGNYFQKEAGMFRDYWDRYDYEWLKIKKEIGIKPYAWVVSAGVGGDACILTVNNLMHQLNFRRVFPTVLAFEDPTEDDLVNSKKLGRQMAELEPADDYVELDPPRKSGRWKWPEKVRVITPEGAGIEAAHAWSDPLAQDQRPDLKGSTKFIIVSETDTVNRLKMLNTGRFHYATGAHTDLDKMIMGDGKYADRNGGPFPVGIVWAQSKDAAGNNLIIAHRDTDKYLIFRTVSWLHQNYERIKDRHAWLRGANLGILTEELKHTFLPIHEGLRQLLKELDVLTNALEERSEENAALIDRYCRAYQECQDLADEKGIPVRPDNPDWLEMWQNCKQEAAIPPVKLFEELSR